MQNRFLLGLKKIFILGDISRIFPVINKTKLVYVLEFISNFVSPRIYSSRKSYSSSIALNSIESEILDTLNNKGYALINNILDEEYLTILSNYLDSILVEYNSADRNSLINRKDHWLSISEVIKKEELTSDNPIIKIFLNEGLLNVVSKYLGSAAFFDSSLLTLSDKASSIYKSSQLWHNDYDGSKVIKVFIYLSDVKSEDDGPFTLLDGAASNKIINNFIPRHLSDDQIFKYVSKNDVVQVCGPKFTAFICDTRKCYHMGSRVTSGHCRILLTGLFLKLPSPYPYSNRRFIRPQGNLTKKQKLALIKEV